MKKTFDCVQMKLRGAEKLQEKLSQMTPEQQDVFWEERTEALRERKTKQQLELKAT